MIQTHNLNLTIMTKHDPNHGKSMEAFKRQVITSKMLFQDLIYKSRARDRTKSVLNPSAQSEALCETDMEVGRKIIGLENALKSAKTQSMELYNLILCISNNGMRISEVLNIQCKDITPLGRFYIYGLKGSNSRIIHDPSISDYLLNCKRNNCQPFMTFNRFFVYRFLKSHGVQFNSVQSTKKSITSAFRHYAIADVNNLSDNLENARQYIGHKSVSATNYYGKQKK